MRAGEKVDLTTMEIDTGVSGFDFQYLPSGPHSADCVDCFSDICIMLQSILLFFLLLSAESFLSSDCSQLQD